MNEEEIVLGAGLAIYVDEKGIRRFVVLDNDDRPVYVYTNDLDPGWEGKLLDALKPKK